MYGRWSGRASVIRMAVARAYRTASMGFHRQGAQGAAEPGITMHQNDLKQLREMADIVFVDKTSAIADLLQHPLGMGSHRCIFFERPRLYGKSWTLSLIKEMLKAGELPVGVRPWLNYCQTDVDALFSGLSVHERFRRGDQSLGALLRRPHFVVYMSFLGVESSADLQANISATLAWLAEAAYGADLEKHVQSQPTPEAALGALISAVPLQIPVALLVDDYHKPMASDVKRGKWKEAKHGIAVLRSLLAATKSPHFGGRIERCVVAGTASFAKALFRLEADHFRDFNAHPLLNAVLGFSEQEIRSTYRHHLEHLGAQLGTDMDGAIAKLRHDFGGFCYDGHTKQFDPWSVLCALGDMGSMGARVTGDARNWLGQTTTATLHKLMIKIGESVQAPDHLASATVDVANLNTRRVNTIALLQQVGLLSLHAEHENDAKLKYRPPNEAARQTIGDMAAYVARNPPSWSKEAFAAVLQQRDRAAFNQSVALLIERVATEVTRLHRLGVKDHRRSQIRFRSTLFGAVYGSLPPAELDVTAHRSGTRAEFFIQLHFKQEPEEAWIVHIKFSERNLTLETMLTTLQAHAAALQLPRVSCCAVLMSRTRPLDSCEPPINFAWSEREGSANFVNMPSLSESVVFRGY